MKKLLKNDGSVLIEAMVALSLITLSFGGIVALVSRGLQLNADTLNKFVAVNLATEGVEMVKASIDTNWDKVRPGMYEIDYNCKAIGYAPCINPRGATNTRSDVFLKRSDNGLYSYETGTITPFKRSVIVASDEDGISVYSVVRWNNRGVENEVQASDSFMRWRK